LVEGNQGRDRRMVTSAASTSGDGGLQQLKLKSGRVAWREIVK
jgi:hypothetical protein